MSDRSLDDYLESSLPAKRPADAGDEVSVPAAQLPTLQTGSSEPTTSGGMVAQFRQGRERAKHELEEAKTIYATKLTLLKHKADAATRESRAFWDAKSVEVAETIKTYVQSTIRALELERMDSRNKALQEVYDRATESLNNAHASDMPAMLKERLIAQICDNLTETVERISEDAIASKYDLT